MIKTGNSKALSYRKNLTEMASTNVNGISEDLHERCLIFSLVRFRRNYGAESREKKVLKILCSPAV